MTREEVYQRIDSERNYQDFMEKTGTSHIVPDFPLSAGLLAIEKILDEARKEWYQETAPYNNTMVLLRKITAIGVKMGERYGMQSNEKLKQYSNDYIQSVINSKS